MIQSNWVRSPSCKPQIHSHARVMRFMPCQRASLHYREQQLVGYDEGVPFPRWYSVSPIQSDEGGGRSAHVWRSVTGKTTTREPRSVLQQLLRPRSRAILDVQHLVDRIGGKKSKIIWVDVFFPLTQIMHSLKCTSVTTCSVPKDDSPSKSSTSHSFMASATELKVTLGVLMNGWSGRWLSLFTGNVWYNPNVPGRINNGWHKGVLFLEFTKEKEIPKVYKRARM